MIAVILSIALEVGVDGRLAVEIARTESYFNPVAVSAVNKDGSVDLGIMQLNSRYLALFVKNYWDKAGVFDWRIPDHNIYVGLRHLKYLLGIPDFNEWQSIMAYNCGEAAVRSGRTPNSSIEYANEIYRRWK